MAEIETEDFIPTKWQHVSTKSEPEPEVPEIEVPFNILKNQIRQLHKLGRENDFQMGQKLAQLKAERSRHRVGSYVKDVNEMKIGGYKRAESLRKFYERVKKIMKSNHEQAAKDKALAKKIGWVWESVEDWERSLDAKGNDKKLADRARLGAEARARVEASLERKKELDKEAASRKQKSVPQVAPIQNVNFTVNLVLEIGELDKFAKAWAALGDEKASEIVYKAVLDATAKNKS